MCGGSHREWIRQCITSEVLIYILDAVFCQNSFRISDRSMSTIVISGLPHLHSTLTVILIKCNQTFLWRFGLKLHAGLPSIVSILTNKYVINSSLILFNYLTF